MPVMEILMLYVIITGEAGNACIVGKNYGEKPISIFLNDNKIVFILYRLLRMVEQWFL